MAAGTATVFRCQLCRRSAFDGRRSHLYSAGHRRRLRAVLGRLGEKVAAARAAARRAEVLPFQAGEHERRVWCPCCAREVPSHLGRGARTVLHGGLLQHLASPEHGRAVLKCPFLAQDLSPLSPTYQLFIFLCGKDYLCSVLGII
uniref:Centrosomal AT-AC splicing factor n=1 Tax=Pseudonaja textilis TaxID=8673 RepID=A0A670Y7N0_PSETE